MTMAYLPRLLCVVLACFGLTGAAVAGFVFVYSRRAVVRASALPARAAARSLFILRSLPFAVAVLVSWGVCLPSYLRYEPSRADEEVSLACVALAVCGAVALLTALVRVTAAALRSARFFRDCTQSGRERREVLILESPRPFLALAGILRPRVVMTRGIVELLSPEELSVVLRHEDAHRSSADNCKRLCAALNPRFTALERAWVRFAEYAADERAVAGDPCRALALASALVRVARCGQQPAQPAAIAFLGDPDDLPARVDRLLAPPALAAAAEPPLWRGVALGLCLAALALNPAALSAVQEVLERLIH